MTTFTEAGITIPASSGADRPVASHDVLGIPVSAVTYDGAVEKIMAAADARRPYAVTALAVHGVMTGAQDREHRFRLRSFDMICPDGQPVRWALNLLHKCGLGDRVYGPTLMLRLCEAAAHRGLPIFLFGATTEMLRDLETNLRRRFPSLVIAGSAPSRFRRATEDEVREDAELIRASGARLVFVGLGCPRQEIWTYEMRPRIDAPLIAVGAAFAFHAGHLSTAPSWMQKRGLEWLYRFLAEPTRLWKRYVILNPLYLAYLGRQLAAGGSSAFLTAPVPPVAEQRFG